jgi:hypothetical protein
MNPTNRGHRMTAGLASHAHSFVVSSENVNDRRDEKRPSSHFGQWTSQLSALKSTRLSVLFGTDSMSSG